MTLAESRLKNPKNPIKMLTLIILLLQLESFSKKV